MSSDNNTTSSPSSEAANWKTKLILDKDGKPRPLLANCVLALRHAPEWEGVLGGEKENPDPYYGPWSLPAAMKARPWETGPNSEFSPTSGGEFWCKDDFVQLTLWFQMQGIHVSSKTAREAFKIVQAEQEPLTVWVNVDSIYGRRTGYKVPADTNGAKQ